MKAKFGILYETFVSWDWVIPVFFYGTTDGAVVRKSHCLQLMEES